MDRIKPFLEHLRTVHFTLIVTCLALLAATLSQPQQDLRLAERDLKRIESAIESSQIPDLVNRSFLIATRGKGSWKAAENGTHAFLLTYTENKREMQLYASFRTYPSVTLEEQIVPVIYTEGNYSRSIGVIEADIDHAEFDVSLASGATLEDFVSFWEGLPHLRAVSVLEAHYNRAKPVPLGPAMEKHYKNNFLSISPIKGRNSELKRSVLKNPFPSVSFSILDNQIYLEFDPSPGVASPSQFGITSVKYLTKVDGISDDSTFTMPVVIPLSTKSIPLQTQSAIIKEFFPGTSPGSFERRFPQLDNWSATNKQRPIKVLIEDIKMDIQRAKDSFEVFGIKIPTTLITKIGTLTIAIVLVYFSLHLRALSKLLKNSSVLPVFPWIGVYPDLTSRSIFIISAICIPTGITLWLFVSSWNEISVAAFSILGFIFGMAEIFTIIVVREYWQSCASSLSMNEVFNV